jgi:hypothetical protein
MRLSDWKCGQALLGGLMLVCIPGVSALEFPGPNPGAANASKAGDVFSLSNNVIAVSWQLQGGTLRPVTLVNKLTGEVFPQSSTELFKLTYGSVAASSDLHYLMIHIGTNTVETMISRDGSMWITLGSFPRSRFGSGDPATVRIGKMNSDGSDSDYSTPGSVGETHLTGFIVKDAGEQTLFSDNFGTLSGWTSVLTGQPGASIVANSGTLQVSAPYNSHAYVYRSLPAGTARVICGAQKYTDYGQTWGAAVSVRWSDGSFVLVQYRDKSSEAFGNRTDKSSEYIFVGLPPTLNLAASDFVLVGSPVVQACTVNPSSGRLSERSPGWEIAANFTNAANKLEVKWRAELRDGANYVRPCFTISGSNSGTPITGLQPLDWKVATPSQSGAVLGTPVTAGSLFFGVEQPVGFNTCDSDRVRTGFGCSLPVGTTAYSFGTVVGVSPSTNLMRRSFLCYIERERPRAYAQLLNYNTFFEYLLNVSEMKFTNSVNTFDVQLIQQRGVPMGSFCLDDGWELATSGLWDIETTKFPHDFNVITARVASAGSHLGLWISPTGGGDTSMKNAFLATAYVQGILSPGQAFDLSITTYYDWFLDKNRSLVLDDGINYLKWDYAVPSYSPQPPHTMALARLADELHQQTPTNLFLSATTGTWPSPFWLNHVDSIFRGGYDCGEIGVGSAKEKTLTYRDAQTYNGVVAISPLYPLNSVMVGGMIANSTASMDIRHDVRCLFGSGTTMQELYIAPSLMAGTNWDELAKVASWSHSNNDVIADTHWVGGNPADGGVYGWASCSPRKAILVLRNPSDQINSIAVEPAQMFELPAGQACAFDMTAPFSDQNVTNLTLVAGQFTPITLQPFEVLIFEGNPRTSYADWIASAFPTNTPAASTDEEADPDGDGRPNLLEYAFHTDPLAPNCAPALTEVCGGRLAGWSFLGIWPRRI